MNPSASGPNAEVPLAALQHLDRTCVEFEEAWKSTGQPQIEQFCGDVPEPERSALLRELLLLELDYRQQRGETPAPAEYHTRFPADAAAVDGVFAVAAAAKPEGAGPGMTRRFGDFKLLEEIARGGMGVVYKARQISLDRVVALKMILSGEFASPQEMERFRNEAKAAAHLQHPHIVAIHEVGEYGRQPFFCMDFVEGQSLRDILRDGPLAARRAAQYVKTMAEAIHYAHQQGTLHRDLKPANVLIDRADQPRITDFGLAKQVRGGAELSGTGQVLGTPSYIPPEQALGRRSELGPASDVYGLGAVLYESLTGRPPFHGETTTDTLLQVIHTEPVSPRLLNPRLPRDLETICLTCLQKEPRRRYASAAALGQDLDRFLRDMPIQARPVGHWERFWRWCRRKPLVAGLAATVLVILLAGTGISSYFAAQATARARDAARFAAQADARAQEATERLWSAYLAQAQAGRRSGIPGQRIVSLKALAAAAAIRPAKELRDEVITCLGLVDLQIERQWKYDRPDDPSVWFDPDLRCYAANDKHGRFWIRWVDGEQAPQELPGGCRRLEDFLFSPQGQLLGEKTVSAAGAECRIWDVQRQTIIFTAPATAEPGGLGFSPDGHSIAIVAPDGKLGIWDVAGRSLLRSFVTDPIPDRVISFHPQGRQVAVFRAFTPIVRVLDADSGSSIRDFSHPAGVCAVAWHPLGTLLAAACDDALIYLWNAETGQYETVMRGHQSVVTDIAFHPAGDLVITNSWDGTTRLWDLAARCQVLATSGQFRQFSRDGRRLASWKYDVLGLWSVATPEHRACWRFCPRQGGPKGVDYSPDGRLLASAWTEGARLWRADTGKEIAFLPLGGMCSAVFSPTGDSLLTTSETGIQTWPMTADGESETLTLGPPTTLSSVVPGSQRACPNFSGTRLAAVVGPDQVVSVSLKPPHQTRFFRPHPGVEFLAISPDDRWLATGTWRGAGGVKVWDLTSGEVVQELLRESYMSRVEFTPDGKWLLTSTNEGFQFWECGTWRPGRRIPREDPGFFTPMAFSRDGGMLAIASARHAVELLELPTFEPLARLEPPTPKHLHWLCFSPDGTQLAAAAEAGHIQLWDLRAIRRQLADLGLDWQLPPYPPAPAKGTPKPCSVKVVFND